MKKLLFFCLSICSVLHCTRTTPGTEVLRIPNSQATSTAILSNVVDSVEAIRLETTPESILSSSINKVIYTDQYIYIADYNFGEYVAIFERNGRFVKKLRPSGEGPGEMADIRSFSVDEEKQEIEVFSAKLKKSVIYSLKGEYIREQISDFYFNDKAYYMGQEYFYSKSPVNFAYFQDGHDYEIFSKNTPLKKIPASELKGNISLFANPFFLSSKELLFCKPMQQEIHKLSEKQIETKYILQFDQHPIPPNFWQVTKDMDRHAYAESKGYAYFLGHFYENNDMLTLTYISENARHWFVLDKQKKKILANSRMASIDGLELSPPHFSYKHHGLYLIQAMNFKEYITNNKANGQISDTIVSIAEQLSFSDNPVLLRICFKG